MIKRISSVEYISNVLGHSAFVVRFIDGQTSQIKSNRFVKIFLALAKRRNETLPARLRLQLALLS